ncbi:MAG: hypothetical protein GW855_04335 [Erythrobacter sp.]|nr:hypothetical protein [Erythrobacter sp.]
MPGLGSIIAKRGPVTVSHPVLRDIRDRMISCGGMTNMDDIARDPRWLKLPAGRRERALRRHEALLEYREGPENMDRAQIAADKAGMSLSSLYKLLPKWEGPAGPDIWALVPYARSTYLGQPRLDPETERTLHSLIEEAVADGVRGTVGISGEVVARWPDGGPAMPASSTIRDHVDSRGGFESVERGTISLNTGRHAQETADTATAYGEVLVVDHSAIDLFLDHPKAPRRATVTLALDLFSASVAGACISEGLPHPDLVMAALDDAGKRSSQSSGTAIKPRLLFSATNGKGWRTLVERVGQRGLIAKVRWGTRLHFGGPIRRMIGTKLVDLRLLSRKSHSRSGAKDRFDPAVHALVTIEEARLVVNDAIDRFNAERLRGQSTAPIDTGSQGAND